MDCYSFLALGIPCIYVVLPDIDDKLYKQEKVVTEYIEGYIGVFCYP